MLMPRDGGVCPSPEAQELDPRFDRALTAPNSKSGGVCTLCKARAEIARRTQYRLHKPRPLPLSQTSSLHTQAREARSAWNFAPNSLDMRTRKFRIKGT